MEKHATIGSVTSMRRGRKTVTKRRNLIRASPGGSGFGGGGIPSLSARFCRMIFLYVSSWNAEKISAARPIINIGHCVHLHPFAMTANPPTGGPIAGPRNGASKNTALAAALDNGGHRSEFVPAPIARQPAPKAPAKKRQTKKEAKPCEKPAPKVNRREIGMVNMYASLRPNVSESGADTMGPKANPAEGQSERLG